MSKKLLAMFLCVILVITLLPVTAMAYNPGTGIWVAGTQIVENTLYCNDDTTGGITPTDPEHSDSFNLLYSDGELTLDGLIVTDSFASQESDSTEITYAICAFRDLTIDLVGDSVISTADTDDSISVAFGVIGDVTFQGNGKLTATAGSAGDGTDAESYGMYVAGDLTVNSGTLIGIGGALGNDGTDYAQSAGAGVLGDLIVSGGSLTGNGGAATGNYGSYSSGISALTITVSGGSLTGNSSTSEAEYALSYGMDTTSLSIQGGKVTAEGKNATGGDGGSFSSGVAANGSLSVSGGELTATGGEAALQPESEAYAQSCGIYAEADTISFSGGQVEATGDEAWNSSFGIRNAGNFDDDRKYESGGGITVSGTADVTANGGTASEDSFGLWCRGAGLSVSGGELTATGGAGTQSSTGICASGDSNNIKVTGGSLTARSENATFYTAALNKALVLGIGVTAEGSTFSDGSEPVVDYVGADNATYRWVSVPDDPALALKASPAGGVSVGTEVKLTTTLVNPHKFEAFPDEYQWYSNAINSDEGAVLIEDATEATYSFRPSNAGKMYYFCKAAGLSSNIVLVTTVQPSSHDDDDDYTPSPVTVYNDPSVPDATVWLTGDGLAANDLLVTRRDPAGSAYQALLKLAEGSDVFATYNISLRSGSKNYGSAMQLTFDLNGRYAGQDFTLVHQKGDSTYEYFYDTADAAGDLTFGPLYELSPFMLVKGTLSQDSEINPNTGVGTIPALWLGMALMAGVSLAVGVTSRRQKQQKG